MKGQERAFAGFSSGGVVSLPGKAQWLPVARGSLTAVSGDVFILVVVISVG